MSRLNRILCLAVALSVVVALPALAATPTVTKKQTPAHGDNNMVLVTVTASGTDVYGVMLTGDAGSIEDIVAPEGWAGVSDGEIIAFHSVDTPIKSGKSLVFRILMKGSGNLGAVFYDAKGIFGSADNI